MEGLPLNGLLRGVLAPWGVGHFGVCRFSDCLPLLPVRSRGRIPPGARSVIVCLFPFDAGQFRAPRNLAGYAVVNDYHRVAGAILDKLAAALLQEHPRERFIPFVDSSPLREVEAARLAGLGLVGRHGQLINGEYGCRVFLGEVVTTLALAPSAPETGACLGCGRCVAACPTGALAEGGPLDKSLCRSAISQKKGALTPWEEQQLRLGGFAWGCDLCASACPLNTGRRTPIREFTENLLPVLTEENLDAALAAKPYAYRGRKVLLRNLAIINGS